jgi:hypothetical protein
MSLTLTRSAAGFALLAAFAAGCGAAGATPKPASSAKATHVAAPATPHAAATHHQAPPVTPPATTPAPAPSTTPPPPPPPPPSTMAPPPANPIPQGNGGDQDADNNGGPSDGDGNV